MYNAAVNIVDQADPTDKVTVLFTLRVGYTYYLPTVWLTNIPGAEGSHLVIQNTNATTAATITYEYYNWGNPVGSASPGCATIGPLAECLPNLPPPITLDNYDTQDAQAIVTSSQPLSVVLTTPTRGTTYVAATNPSSSLVAPLILNNAFGSFVTNLTIFNSGSAAVTATVQYYDQHGNLQPNATQNLNLPPHIELGLNSLTAYESLLPEGFVGWAQIIGSPGSQLLAQVGESSNAFASIVNAQPGGATMLYAPTIFNGAFGDYASGASILNPNPNPVTVNIAYYDNQGHALPPTSLILAPHALAAIYHGGTEGSPGGNGIPVGGLPKGFYGSVTIISEGGGVVMLVNEIGPVVNSLNIASGSYTAVPVGSSSLNLPIIAKGGYGYTTGLTILNTSNANVNGTIQYYNTDGTPTRKSGGGLAISNFNLAAHGSYPEYQGGVALPDNFYGMALITQTNGPANSLIATTNAISSSFFYTYTLP